MKKIAVITGTSSGIGKQSAKLLANNGFLVYALSRENLKASKNIIPIQIDITNYNEVKAKLKDIKKIDLLVNNAGYGLVSSLEDAKISEIRNQFNINVFALLNVTKVSIPKLKNGGVIINISSFLGKVGLPMLTLYNATKYAVEGITDSLRYELKEFDIRVHSIMPGFFNTQFAKKNLIVNKYVNEKNLNYKNFIQNLLPKIIKQINGGNDAKEVANLILQIYNDKNAKARYTAGSKSKKFIPMRRVLSDEEFEERVKNYYGF